jgi:hypothetical protein
LAAGLILLIGVMVDLAALWILQRQDSLQWEFVALGTTTNSFPLLILSAVLLYGYLALSQSTSRTAYRIVGSLVLLLGLFGLGMVLMTVTNYFALMRGGTLQPAAVPFFRGVLVKSGGLSAVYAAILLPVGILGLRSPKR